MTEVSPEDAAAQRAAEQARIRKERREAKIKAGGSARLNKITGLGGRAPEEAKPVTATPAATATPATTNDHADPEEVDISEHYYKPTNTRRPEVPPGGPGAMSEAQLRQMMLGFEPPPGAAGPGGPAPGMQQQQQQQQPDNPFAAAAAQMGAADDPMMKMLSQMMAGAGGGADGAANPFAGGFPGMMPGQAQAARPAPSTAATTWRLVHAIFALALGFYIAFTTRFTGSRAQREQTAMAFAYPAATGPGDAEVLDEVEAMEEGREVFFWMFATAEALLITTRFIIEGGKPAGEAGMAWTVAGFLPQPWRMRLETALRYMQIFSSVRRDILVCVFVLGVASLVRG